MTSVKLYSLLFAMAALALAMTMGAFAVSVTIGSITFDTDNSVTNASITTSGTTTSTFGVGEFNDDPTHTMPQLLGMSASDTSIDIASTNSSNSGRTELTVTWDAGDVLANGAGDDFVILEQGTPTFVEAFGVAVRPSGSSTFTTYRYEFYDTSGSNKNLTAFDLDDFGIAAADAIDAIRIINIHSVTANTPSGAPDEDRVDDASGEGNLILDAGSGSGFGILQGPTSGAGNIAYPDGALDADITYVCGLQTVGPPLVTGYLYYVGGGLANAGDATTLDGTLTLSGDNGVFSVLVANVNVSEETVEDWRYATGSGNQLPDATNATGYSWMFLENAVHAHNGRLYVGPGDWNSDASRATADIVIWADINPDGTLGTWTQSAAILNDSTDQAICATAIAADASGEYYYYVMGGTFSGIDTVAYAPIDGVTGALGAWSSTTVLPSTDWFNRATVADGRIVHTTGNLNSGGDRHSHSATVNVGGGLSAWTDTLVYDATAGNRWDHAMTTATTASGDWAIVIGGNTGGGVVDTVHTALFAGGSAGAWGINAAAYLPGAQRHVTAVGADDMVIALGGTTAGNSLSATTAVQIGIIDNTGEITWTTSPNAMSQARGLGGAAFWRAPTSIPTTAVGGYELYR